MINSSKNGTASNSHFATEKMLSSLEKRRRKEVQFKWLGRLAVALGFFLVLVLIADITSKALPAFHQHWVKLDINFQKEWLQVNNTDHKSITKANYRKLLKRSLYQMFPEVKGRKAKRNLFKMISSNAEFTIKSILMTNPNLMGKRASVWVRLDDDIDNYLKAAPTLGKANARVDQQQVKWVNFLTDNHLIKKRFNFEFFTNGDSREPELAGVRGALTGTILTMLVTLALSFPLGVAAALYLEEFASRNKWTDIIEVNINNLAAVPSIIFGLLGLAVIINIFNLPRSSPLVGGIVLTLMTLPTIIIASRASIKAVPSSIREAAMGIGALKMQTAFSHVQVLKMGGLVEQQVSYGLMALLNADEGLGQKVVDKDTQVNAMEVSIDETCTEILARRQPAASDLRLMVSIIKTITDLERIGDEAEKPGRYASSFSGDSGGPHQLIELRNLGMNVKKMLSRSLNAYARMDVEEALDIIQSDELIDEEYDKVSRLLILKMMEDPREIKSALRISWCARALERIGDHSTNICEYIVYLVKGEDVRHTRLGNIKKKIED